MATGCPGNLPLLKAACPALIGESFGGAARNISGWREYMRGDRTETPAAQPQGQAGSLTPGAPQRRRVQTFTSLRSKDYRLLWMGNVFDHMALWLQMITLSWLVWDLTGSALLSGTAAGLRGFPTLIIGPWAGVVADRVDRRKVVIVVQVFLSVVAFGFALMVATATVQVWHAFAYAGVSAVCFAFIMPARSALIVNTVPPGDLGNAFALNAMTVTVNRLIGGMLGGLLITEVGITWNFLVEGLSYLAAALLLIPMRTPYRRESTARRESVLSNLRAGFLYIWRENRIILHLIIMSLILTFGFIPLPALLPAYAGEVLNAEANVGGYLMAAQGVGGVTTTFLIASLGFGVKKGKLGLVALVVGSAAILTLSLSHWLLLSLAMMVALGLCQTSFIVSNQTIVQQMTPDNLRGRVTSIYMLEHGLGPVGIFLTGLLMDLYTVSGALTLISSVSLVTAIFFLLVFRRVRQLE